MTHAARFVTEQPGRGWELTLELPATMPPPDAWGERVRYSVHLSVPPSFVVVTVESDCFRWEVVTIDSAVAEAAKSLGTHVRRWAQ